MVNLCIYKPFTILFHNSYSYCSKFLSFGIRANDLEMIESIATHQAFIEFYFKSRDHFWWLIKLYELFALYNTPLLSTTSDLEDEGEEMEMGGESD